MTTAKKLLSTQTGGDKLYVDDVFSTYLYTGNGSTKTINNGIDLAGEGGLVWIKNRTFSPSDHNLYDTVRGTDSLLRTNQTTAQVNVPQPYEFTSFNPDGFSVGQLYTNPYGINKSGDAQVAWTFRKAPKFFDVVTYTGNGVAGRQIPHALGIAPGMITSKSTSTTGDWNTYHRSATGDLVLNMTATQTGSRTLITAASDSTFTVSGAANTNGVQYVAYLWAHDESPNGLIQCGSYVGNASTGNIVNLGWEPQYVMVKQATGPANQWFMYDTMRGMYGSDGINNPVLYANISGYEELNNVRVITKTDGFFVSPINGSLTTANQAYIYLAIRRPNKPPTSGVEVYNAIARTGTGADATVSGGIPVDMVLSKARTVSSRSFFVYDRLRGIQPLLTSDTSSEVTGIAGGLLGFDVTDGVRTGADSTLNGFNGSGYPYIVNFLRRAPGFFDVVCYTGTGVACTVPHNLGAVPELMIVKVRNNIESWYVYHKDLGPTKFIGLNSSMAAAVNTPWNDTAPSKALLSVGHFPGVNKSDANYVAYLFASCPRVSKVGSYTGNGTSLSVECRFSTGARFILVKSVDDVGDWFVWDSARGIVAANDPHLSLNTTAVEVTTDDSVDPYAGGFIVNQNTATNININGKRYIFLAIA